MHELTSSRPQLSVDQGSDATPICDYGVDERDRRFDVHWQNFTSRTYVQWDALCKMVDELAGLVFGFLEVVFCVMAVVTKRIYGLVNEIEGKIPFIQKIIKLISTIFFQPNPFCQLHAWSVNHHWLAVSFRTFLIHSQNRWQNLFAGACMHYSKTYFGIVTSKSISSRRWKFEDVNQKI